MEGLRLRQGGVWQTSLSAWARFKPTRIWNAAKNEPDLAILSIVVLTLPLELSKQLFPVQILEISRVAMVAGFVVLSTRLVRGLIVPVPRVLVAAILVAVSLAGLSLAATRWPNGIRIEAATATYAVFAFFVAQTVRDARRLRIIATVLVASGVVVAIVLLIESLFNIYVWRELALGVLGRRNGTFADPNITSRFLSLTLIAILALLVVTRFPPRRTWVALLTASVLLGVGQALTQSRAGWLVAIVPVGLWIVFVRPWARTVIPVVAFALGFAFTLTVNPAALQRASSTAQDVSTAIGAIKDGHSPGSSKPTSGGDSGAMDSGPPLAFDPVLDRMPLDSVRRYLARAGIAMFIDHPLVGVGLGGFQPEILGPYSVYIPADRVASPVSLPHTELVRIAAETGVVGLLALTLLAGAIAWVLWSLRRAPPSIRLGAGAVGLGIVSIFVASQFEGRLFDEPYLWLLVGLAASLPGIATGMGATVASGTTGT